MYCCNIRTESAIECQKLVGALNAILPRDIAALNCREVDYDFHARYDCKGKEYVYLIYNGKHRNPFYENKAMFYPYEIDAEMLNNEARSFIGTHDFSAFCSVGSSVEDKTREIYDCKVTRNDDIVEIRVSGNGFLYNMVRIMAGTLLYVCCGKIKPDEIPHIIMSKDRTKAGITAPPDGLYLNKVYFSGGANEG
jgi:tRNA pseudouridine38-40 synthase